MKNVKTFGEYAMYAESDDGKVVGFVSSAVLLDEIGFLSEFVTSDCLQTVLEGYNAGRTIVGYINFPLPCVEFFGKIDPPRGEKISVTYNGRALIMPDVEKHREGIISSLAKKGSSTELPRWFNNGLLRAPLEEVIQYCEAEELRSRN